MRQLGFLVFIAATGLTGIVVAGCASRIQTVIVNDEGGIEEGGPRKVPSSSGSSGSACPDPTPIDANQLPWKAPRKTLGACTPTT